MNTDHLVLGMTDAVVKQGARLGWLRLVTAAVLAATSLVALIGLPLALQFYDGKADTFAALTYDERQFGVWHGVPTAIRDRDVVKMAAAEMPLDAHYRVVIGPGWIPEWTSNASRSIEADFLRFYLLPRLQTTSADAPWVFCFRCDMRRLGRDVRIVAEADSGLRFVEVTS
jgi:hypothetical protein